MYLYIYIYCLEIDKTNCDSSSLINVLASYCSYRSVCVCVRPLGSEIALYEDMLAITAGGSDPPSSYITKYDLQSKNPAVRCFNKTERL